MAVVGAAATNDNEDEDEGIAATKVVKPGQRVGCPLPVFPSLTPVCQPFYTAEEMKSFRTLGLEPGELSIYQRLVFVMTKNDISGRVQASWIQTAQRAQV